MFLGAGISPAFAKMVILFVSSFSLLLLQKLYQAYAGSQVSEQGANEGRKVARVGGI